MSKMDINREVSFRGRVYHGRAHWAKKGVKNVITYYLNVIGRDLRGAGYWDDIYVVSKAFIVLDFHEWLHLFIRRESGLKNTYIVTDECENFIREAQDYLDWILEVTFPDSRVDYDWFKSLGVGGSPMAP